MEEGINGFVLLEHQDANVAASRIVNLSNAQQRQVMGTAALQTAAMHDWERLTEEIEKIYEITFDA